MPAARQGSFKTSHEFDGSTWPLQNLERPQLWFDENGNPAVLFCAARVKDPKATGVSATFNVHIPVQATFY